MIFLSLILHAFHAFRSRFWVFLKIFGGFSKLMKFLWNFWDGFCVNDPKCSCITSHLHFNYMFRHFRCVITMLNCCVLVGLDWAEPMMLLSLHVTCSCIFMHTYLQFFIFFYIVCCCFSDCLSRSLSLLLVLVCSMAPKCKSISSQNPFCSRASISSSNPTPSHVWFRDDKAWNDFSENFSRWGIYSERQVILSDFSDTNLPTVIYSRGWGLLCDIPATCLSVIIHDFYSNHGFDIFVPHFFSRVRSTCIVFTPNIVSKVLHVPRVTHLDYSGYDRLRTVSKDELSSLFCETLSS